jgi:flavodoxin
VNTLIVYDSVFGNTEKIAFAIGASIGAATGAPVDGLPGPQGNCQTLSVSQVTPEKMRGLDLLIIGSPTRGFRPTEGMAKLLGGLSNKQLQGVRVAAFDTRIALEQIESSVLRFIVDKGGYAARTIAKTLQKKGGDLIAPPEGFYVTGEQGPLKEGELERAAEWARQFCDG